MVKGFGRAASLIMLAGVLAQTSAASTAAAQAGASKTMATPVGPSRLASSGSIGPSDANYRLGTGDKLRVIVFGETNLTGEFVISDSGDVSFPLIGAVHAAGSSVAEFQEAVRTKLADGYLRDPRVSVEVQNYRPFYILGEVQKPGEYPYTSGLTVMNAVATAGGFTYRANTKVIIVRHAGADKEQPMKLTASAAVGPGDTIVIRERFF